MFQINKLSLTILLILLLVFISQTISAKVFKVNPLLKSALLPGWGQLSLDRNYGYAMLTTEALFWSSYFYNVNEQDLKQQDSYEYALKFAHVNPGDYSAQYYRDLSTYNSSGFEAGGYNAMVRQIAISIYPNDYALQQTYIDENSIPDEMSWNWDSADFRKNFSSKRRELLELKDSAQLFTGLLIANHILSSIDMLRLKKHWGGVQTSFQYYRNTPVLNLRVKF